MGRFLLEREGPKVTVKIGAGLTVETASELRELLCAIQEDGVTDLSLDFSGTTALDATGVALLVAAANSYRGGDKRLSVLSVPRSMFTLMQTLRIVQRLNAQMG
jgi:anti-anti-sigma regulatory factor